MDSTITFAEGEKVLCYHGPYIYEAKCLQVALLNKRQQKYLVHYVGWNKKYDEWVLHCRILKYNEENLRQQKELQELDVMQNPKAKTSNRRKKYYTRAQSQNDKKGGKSKGPGTRTRGQVSSTTDGSMSNSENLDLSSELNDKWKVKIPKELKQCLVSDWDLITLQGKLAIIPVKPCVDEILENYLTYRKSMKTTIRFKEYTALEVTKGYKEYFNVTLSTCLLYKFEKQQYAEIVKDHPDTPMSKIYGGVHLLRLFVQLGPLLYCSLPQPEKNMDLFFEHIYDFLKYMTVNSSTLFDLQRYVKAPVE